MDRKSYSCILVRDRAAIGVSFTNCFECLSLFRYFHVYDVDTKYHNIPMKMLKLKDQEFLGEATYVLSEIVTKQTRSLTLNLHIKNGHMGLRNFGALTIHAEEIVASRSCVETIVHCSHLDNKDLLSKSDPFLRISRIVETGGYFPIFKSEVVNNNLNPIWKPLCLSVQQFGSKWQSCAYWSLLLKDDIDLEKLHKERSGANLTLPSSCRGHDKYSFLGYISSGSELNFMVAVDFTASNGNPQNPDSLHYIDPSGRLNSYQWAILEVGEVIQFYDSDRCFPAWGFGGRTCNGTSSHYFNLNGSAGAFEMSCYPHERRDQPLKPLYPCHPEKPGGPLPMLLGPQLRISVVQALLEELLGQFLTYMR
ncbi:protein bonzai 3, partial [Quercus suber]